MNLITGHDLDIARWTAAHLGVDTLNRLAVAIGVADDNGTVIGAAVLHNWSRYDMELSYYGPGTMTAGMMRTIAQNVADAGCHRLTARCRRGNVAMRRALPKLGFHYEGTQMRLYGPSPADDGLLFGITADRAARFMRPIMRKAA